MTLPYQSLSHHASGTSRLSGGPNDQDSSAALSLRRDGAMKLILNVESIVPPVTGIGRYTSEILGGLLARGLGDDLHCFSHFRWVDARSVINASSGLPVPNRVRPFLRSLPYAYELRCIARNAVFRRSAKSLVGAVYHEPNYILKPYDGPTIVNCHDLSHLLFPEHHRRSASATWIATWKSLCARRPASSRSAISSGRKC